MRGPTPTATNEITVIAAIVATAIEHEIKDPRLAYVTVTDARVTNDLHDATIYYTVMGESIDAEPDFEAGVRCVVPVRFKIQDADHPVDPAGERPGGDDRVREVLIGHDASPRLGWNRSVIAAAARAAKLATSFTVVAI